MTKQRTGERCGARRTLCRTVQEAQPSDSDPSGPIPADVPHAGRASLAGVPRLRALGPSDRMHPRSIHSECMSASKWNFPGQFSTLSIPVAFMPHALVVAKRRGLQGVFGPEFAGASALLYSGLPSAAGLSPRPTRKATWRSGYATVCKTVYPGSIPGVASNNFNDLTTGRTTARTKLPPSCHRLSSNSVQSGWQRVTN